MRCFAFLAMMLSLVLSRISDAGDFTKTSGGKQEDASSVGGMDASEVSELEKAALQNAYFQAINKSVKQFQKGRESSGVGGSGRYSNTGEMHNDNLDGMVSHPGASNGLESVVENAALGSATLDAVARAKKEQEIMDKNVTKIPDANQKYDPKTGITNRVVNNASGQAQKQNFDLSAVTYDAGAAHSGDGNDPHRVYMVKKEVRDAVEKKGGLADQYAAQIKKDATLEPGKKPNLDLLNSEMSWLEQVKAQNMKSDALALKAARLAGFDTSDPSQRGRIAEFKQLAMDTFAEAKFQPGAKGVAPDAAVQEIQAKLTERVTRQKVLGTTNRVCLDGTVSDSCKSTTSNGQADPKNKDYTADKIKEAASEVAFTINGNRPASPEQVANVEAKLRDKFNAMASTPNAKLKKDDLLQNFNLASLSGISDPQTIDARYKEAEAKISPDQAKEMAKLKQKLTANKCLAFDSWCYSRGVGTMPDSFKNLPPDQVDYAQVQGDPGSIYNDTRELVYGRFAQAIDAPLDQFERIVNNSDFSEGIDRLAKGNVGLYGEFKKYLNDAKAKAAGLKKMDQRIVDIAKANGTSQAGLSQFKKNYTDPKKFNTQTMSFMKLFGQNKNRDGVIMEWRKRGTAGVLIPKKYGESPPTALGANIPPTQTRLGGARPGAPGQQQPVVQRRN